MQLSKNEGCQGSLEVSHQRILTCSAGKGLSDGSFQGVSLVMKWDIGGQE